MEKKKVSRPTVPTAVRNLCWDCAYRGTTSQISNGTKKRKAYCKLLKGPCELAYLECEYREA